MCELQGELLIVVEEGVCFGHYAPPLLLVSGHDSEGRLQALVVKLCLKFKKKKKIKRSD